MLKSEWIFTGNVPFKVPLALNPSISASSVSSYKETFLNVTSKAMGNVTGQREIGVVLIVPPEKLKDRLSALRPFVAVAL